MKYPVFLLGLELCQLALIMWLSPRETVIKAKPFRKCSFGDGKRVEDEAPAIKGPTYCFGKGSKGGGGSLAQIKCLLEQSNGAVGLIEVDVCSRGLEREQKLETGLRLTVFGPDSVDTTRRKQFLSLSQVRSTGHVRWCLPSSYSLSKESLTPREPTVEQGLPEFCGTEDDSEEAGEGCTEAPCEGASGRSG